MGLVISLYHRTVTNQAPPLLLPGTIAVSSFLDIDTFGVWDHVSQSL
jgi:hypothetical protein